MSKRRRASGSSSASRGGMDEDEDSPQISEPVRKKRKQDPLELVQQVYDTIRNHKKDDGSLLCDSFIRVPKRRQEPAYYEVVSNPIDLLKVQQKLKTDEYEDIDDLAGDIELLVSNTKAFYKRTSQEHKDATELWELFQSTKNRMLEEPKASDEPEQKGKIILKVGKLQARKAAAAAAAAVVAAPADEDTSEGSTNHDDELALCEELFTAVMTVTDQDGRPLHTVFQLLPSKKRYPKYYEVIESPIDLRTVARRIQQSKYTCLNEMERDLLLMVRNACTFNEPGSQIYKDAKALRKAVQTKRVEVEQGTGKASERSRRNKRLRGGAQQQSMSAITAALKGEADDSDDEDSILEAEEPDNPRWQLFETVRSAANANGALLSEPFWKLPSKRHYPDYYKEIKNPMCLAHIGIKLKKGHYGTVSEVAGDMNIMFENAKKYNRADSRLYKDAVKLQKLMQKRVQELLDFNHQYSDSEDDSADEPPAKKPRGSSKLITRGKYLNNLPLKRRLYTLCKCLVDYCEDGRQPMLMFMEKPSKKIYPDYYKVISDPIDMLTIEANIKAEKYTLEDEIINDFKRMFNNCRKYNEEGSMIHDDAIKLEKILLDHVKELGPLVKRGDVTISPSTLRLRGHQVKRPPGAPAPPPPSQSPSLAAKCRILFNTIRDYRDPKGRQLAHIFLRLPSKQEYPDYYEVIKRPMNLEQILQKLRSYDNMDDLISDFVLMFDNACKYNEPDSQIYKDALMLQRVMLQTKMQLREDEQSVPDVRAAVQELLTSLFTAVYNHQDEEGRCFSDSMQELPEHDDVDGNRVRALSLDLIKRRLDTSQYRRLDLFQEDLFSCMERARQLSRTDSQVFEDSIELQSYFIRQRDELCRNGDLLHSPALNFTLMDLSTSVDTVRQAKLLQEPKEEEEGADQRIKDEEEDSSRDGSSSGPAPPAPTPQAGTADNALSYNQQVYRIGDFVYAEPKERNAEPLLLNIQRLWTNQEGHHMLYGNQFFRPNETYHVTTRRFLEKEVFKTEVHIALPLNQVQGRCCVLSVKDYFRFRPEGFAEKDIYVCESRYSCRARAFKKIKVWPPSLTCGFKLTAREEPLEANRVMSVFRDRVEKHKEEIAELEGREKLTEKDKPNVELTTGSSVKSEEGCTYFEQFNAPTCVIKLGDCVYMKPADSSAVTRQLMCQVDSIWTNKEGEGLFLGPWVVLPTEVPHSPTRMFYKQEVFVSTLEETHPVSSVLNKCAVLEHSEYISCRPTEIPESDVFVCESLYEEAKQTIVELPREGLKKYTHSPAVMQDEIYFFRRLINPPKVGSELAVQGQTQAEGKQFLTQFDQSTSEPSALLGKVDPETILEDSLDGGGPPSAGSGDTSNLSQPGTTTPLTSKKAKSNKKLVTGYILYSSDVRKNVTSSNPDSSFGEISRIVGNEWRKLPAMEKVSYEEKAQRMNEETHARALEAEQCPSPAGANSPAGPAAPPHPDTIWECCWDTCDWQFEDPLDAIEHAVAEGSGHVNMYFAAVPPQELEFQCQWRGCQRMRKPVAPFPNLHRLGRHVKEVHIQRSPGKVVPPDQRSKNFVPSTRKSLMIGHKMANSASNSPMPGFQMHAASMAPGILSNMSRNTPSPLSQNGGPGNGCFGGRQADPLFVTVPPRPQRVLHSEAYIRYIEGLSAENRSVGNWDRQLKVTQAGTEPPPDPARLPVHWLANGVGNHGNIVNALWMLRDFMFRDALGIAKII